MNLRTILSGVVLFTSALRADVTITTIARLGGHPNGETPHAALVKGADGTLYGTTTAGSPVNRGTVYKVTTDGKQTTLHAFTGGSDGNAPVASLVVGSDGNLYGTTPAGGGAHGQGTVFKVTPAGAFTTLHAFTALDASNIDGANPQAALLLGKDGNFYGTASSGGKAGVGTVFKITPAGAFTTLYAFAPIATDTDPYAPKTGLAQGNDGSFYGTAESNVGGVIYKLTPAGKLSVLHALAFETEGDLPGTLVRGRDSNFYGTAQNGGGNGGGTAFKITPTGTMTVLHSFDPSVDGVRPLGPLFQATDGNFYGATANDGPANGTPYLGYGTIFRLSPAGAFKVLYTFNYSSVGGNSGEFQGSMPLAGVVQGADGDLHGTTSTGGANGGGTVFQLTPAGALTTTVNFTHGGDGCYAALFQAADGNLYGTTTVGGTHGGGTVFEYATSGKQISVGNLNPPTDGSRPGAPMIQDPDGNIFAVTTQDGGDGRGTLLEYTPNAVAREVYVYSFVAAYRAEKLLLARGNTVPLSPQTNAPDTFYGIFQSGGASNTGAIFSYVLGAAHETLLHEFGSQINDGLTPQGLVQASDGNLYGTTLNGGTAGLGTIFKYTPAGVYTTLYSFAGTGDGAHPEAGLIEGADGNLYGTTAAANASSGYGTIFSVTTDGAFKTLHTFPGNDGLAATPIGELLQATNGLFYGVTFYGGTSNSGAIYSITTGGTFTVEASFTNYAEGNPSAALIQATDGNLYGVTPETIYRVTLPLAKPVITSANTAAAAVGQPFTYQITATNHPTNYGVLGLSPGLHVDGKTGVISGTPTGAAGTKTLTLKAANAAGSAQQTLTLTINPS